MEQNRHFGKMVKFERLPKIFEMNGPKITVPFDSAKNFEFFTQMDRAHYGKKNVRKLL